MPRVGFQPTVPASARAKIFHALDRSATVTGRPVLCITNSAHFILYLGHVRIVTSKHAPAITQ
jgi:hypothetical protein